MGVSEARSALRRARRDQLLAIVSIASASLRIRLARGRLGVLRSVAHWKKRTRRRLRLYTAGATRLRGWLD